MTFRDRLRGAEPAPQGIACRLLAHERRCWKRPAGVSRRSGALGTMWASSPPGERRGASPKRLLRAEKPPRSCQLDFSPARSRSIPCPTAFSAGRTRRRSCHEPFSVRRRPGDKNFRFLRPEKLPQLWREPFSARRSHCDGRFLDPLSARGPWPWNSPSPIAKTSEGNANSAPCPEKGLPISGAKQALAAIRRPWPHPPLSE